MGNILEALASPVVEAVGGILGAVGNVVSTNMTNKTNKGIANAQNELNYKMFQEQNEWNLAQWHRENEYNSPSAQRARLEAAGYNPYSLLGQSSLGGVSAQGVSSAQAQPAAGWQAQNPMYGAAFTESFKSMAEGMKSLEESRMLNVQNKTEDDLRRANLDILLANGRISRKTYEKLKLEIQQTKDTYDSIVSSAQSKAKTDFHNAQIQEMQSAIMREFGVQKASGEVMKLVNDAALAAIQGDTEKAQQLYYDILGKTEQKKVDIMDFNAKTERLNAVTNRLVGEATAENQRSQATESRARTAYQNMVNSVYQLFGRAEEATNFLQMLNDLKGQSIENQRKAIELYVEKHTRRTKQFGTHMRNIFGWLPFMVAPFEKVPVKPGSAKPMPVRGFAF